MSSSKVATKTRSSTGRGKRYFDLRSFPVQIIIGFLGIAILTSIIAGLPALWLIRNQLEYQAWSQIDQGQRAVQAIYAARRAEILNSAILTSQRPTLHKLLSQSDPESFLDYLRTLQQGEGLDVILICSLDGQSLMQTADLPANMLCKSDSVSPFFVNSGTRETEAWLLASQRIETGGELLGIVFVGIQLDDEYAADIRDQTGLEHAILLNDLVVASSKAVMPERLATVQVQSPLLTTPIPGTCCIFELESQPYYAARLPLNESGLVIQVALEVTGIFALQKHLGLLLFGSAIIVAAIGSGIGVFLARRISQPLVGLARAAAHFSQGNLTDPVSVQTGAHEVIQVSQALETARKHLLKMLTDLEIEKNRINHLLESIVEGIMTLNKEYQITFFSHGAERITSWRREDVLQRSCDEVFKLAESTSLFSQTIPLPGQRSKCQVEVAGRKQITLSITRALVKLTEANEEETAVVFRDVSEEEIIHRLLSYFLANVAHEFRTPLSALAASVELLMDQLHDLSPDELNELLKSLHLGILSLQTLIDNLLESASIEAGHFRVSPKPYSLHIVINEAIEMMQPLLDKYNQVLIIDLPASLPLVMADPRRVVQVLVNLLSNASKYGPSDAEIKLSAGIRNGWVRVEVADRGPGIPMSHRDLLFRRFEHLDAADRRAKVGAGLGLSVVKAVIEHHGGQTSVDERTGGGSIFWFTLPIARET